MSEELARIGPPCFPKIHAEDPWVREILLDRLRKQGRKDHLVAWAPLVFEDVFEKANDAAEFDV